MIVKIYTVILYFYRYVDDNKKKFLELLSQAVSIKSVSADPSLRDEVVKMIQWAQVKLQALGANVVLYDVGSQVWLYLHNTNNNRS